MDPFIGQITTFGFNFAPRGWAFCEGQLMPISQNTALFSLLGTIYGGDGRTTFALPDLRGRVIIGPGRGPGLSDYRLGTRGGAETVTLTTAEMPSHNHGFALGDAGASPAGTNALIGKTTGADTIFNGTSGNAQLAGSAISNTGGGQAHENRMPYLAMHNCIALVGIFPSRS
jgi:microcystin-dependent protein